MTQTYRITPRAEADRYLRALDARFQWLAENPGLGQKREDVAAGYYCYPQGKHLIFYMLATDGIDIIGIPHQRMDPGSYR